MLYYYLIVFSFLLVIVNSYGNGVFPCITPNNEMALCVSLFTCPVLMKALGTLEPSAVNFVKQSTCYDYHPGDLMICCGTLGNFGEHISVTPSLVNVSSTTSTSQITTNKINTIPDKPTKQPNEQNLNSKNVTQKSHRDFVKRKLLPTRTYCGLQHTDDRFYNDTTIALDEFPWLVDLPFIEDEDEDPLQYRDRCNGVLISNRYVLTIGTCANQVSKVRLGQYHTNTTVSCIENPAFPECNEPKYFVNVEEEIHRTNGTIAQHDFALLRLVKKVSYSDFVRPICLPFNEPGDPEKRDSLVFTGWGALEENTEVSKKRLPYNVTNIVDKCFKLDKDGLKEAASNVSVVCLIPKQEIGEFACAGDEGSPLMYSHQFQWFAEALVTKVYDAYDEFKATGIRTNSTFDNDKCSNKLLINSSFTSLKFIFINK